MLLLSAAALSSAAGFAAAAPQAMQEPVPTCVAIVLPSVRGVEGSAVDVGAAVRELLATYLNGPSMQAMLLDARLTSHAFDEARQKDCPNVVMMTLTRKRKGGSGLVGRIVSQAGSSAAWGIPGGSVTTAVARGAVVAASEAVSELAGSTREKDQLTLNYIVTGTDGRTVLPPREEKAKAKADGEDLVTPLVEEAAAAIAAAVSAR